MSLAKIIIDNCSGIGSEGSIGIAVVDNAQFVEISNSTAEGEVCGMYINQSVTDSLFINLSIKGSEILSDGAIIESAQNNIFDNLVITSKGGGLLLYDSVIISNSSIYSGSSNGVEILSSDVQLINTSIYSANNHAIDLNAYDDCSIINCNISVGNSTKKCINSPAPVNTSYAKNVLSGATVAIDPNVTQAIIATEDNQGNLTL